MADDTRLAEASLLLNYSNQSYKEQMSLTKAIKQDGFQQLVTVKVENHDQLNDKDTPSKLITPPPEHEYALENKDTMAHQKNFTSQTFGELRDYIILENDNLIVQNDTGGYYYPNYYHESQEPLNNLLAAVNCALPCFKNHPNIMQSSSNFTTSPSTTTKIHDHDYCQREQVDKPREFIGHTESIYVTNSFENNPFATNQAHLDERANSEYALGKKSKRKQKHSSMLEFQNPFKKPLKLVAIHLGAGNSHHESESLRLAKMICEEVMLQTSASTNLIPSTRRKRKTYNSNSFQESQTQICECCNHNTLTGGEHRMTAESAVVRLIQLMEDHQSLNCGFGSNLNIKGQVECDASLMSDRTQTWTGVGAVSGCRNPILLAKSLYDHRTIARPLGLKQPNILVASGAKQWMREHCPHLSIVDSKMVSSKAFSTYQKLKSRYDAAVRFNNQKGLVAENFSDNLTRSDLNTTLHNQTPQSIQDTNQVKQRSSPTNLDHGFYCLTTGQNFQKVESFAKTMYSGQQHEKQSSMSTSNYQAPKGNGDLNSYEYCNEYSELQNLASLQSERLDTVGAIAVDCDNNFASAISSGGLLLKYKGRLGQAAIPGAGCWSEDSVAVTTTGVGEYLTLNMFAKKFYDKIVTLRLLYDLGHVEKKSDLSDLVSCQMDECFEDLISSPALDHVPVEERLAGMLSVCTLNSKKSAYHRVDDNDLYLSYAHNTNTMCVGYMTCNDIVGHSIMSRKTNSEDKSEVTTIKISLASDEDTNSHIVTGSSR